MLIDDDPATHIYHRLMIEEAGYDLEEVETFTSVDEAISALKNAILTGQVELIPQYIVLDLNMPIKDGWDFLEECEQVLLSDPKPEVYVVSNSEHPSDVQKAEAYQIVKGFRNKFLESDFFTSLPK